MKKRPAQHQSVSSRPAPIENIPEAKPPSSTSEWFLFRAKNVYKQLTLNWGRKIVVGAFPFIAYFSVTFFDYRRTRYNFQLQQADFFKQSIACIANSPEVRGAYGKDIKLKRASFWTVTSGFVPWINERHVWLGFSGQHRDGWIRMGLRRTDFVLDKEVVKLISQDIEKGLKRDMEGSLSKVKSDEENSSTSTQDEQSAEKVVESTTDIASASEVEEVQLVEGNSQQESENPTVEEAKPQSSEKQGDGVHGSYSERDHSLTTKERLDIQIAKKENEAKLTREQNEKYMAEMRRLYPTLPENFGQNDVEQAVAIKKDRLIDGQIFNNTWDLLSLSIHPEETKDGQVYVLWDPEQSYVDQADYWIDTAWVSIKKPKSMRTPSVAVVDRASPVAEG